MVLALKSQRHVKYFRACPEVVAQRSTSGFMVAALNAQRSGVVQGSYYLDRMKQFLAMVLLTVSCHVFSQDYNIL
ncbi:MAG: hypothetical protein R3301_03815, partial [Saprospiraceae bacterium]|nr:hypothetical protein [Saprospiraceae bacterium]